MSPLLVREWLSLARRSFECLPIEIQLVIAVAKTDSLSRELGIYKRIVVAWIIAEWNVSAVLHQGPRPAEFESPLARRLIGHLEIGNFHRRRRYACGELGEVPVGRPAA